MKIYEMHQAKGERITVSSLAQAQQVMADFEPFADRFLAEVERATSVEDEPFAFLQRIATRWNANYEVWKAMEADEELQLADRKTADIERAQAIKEMARKCRDN